MKPLLTALLLVLLGAPAAFAADLGYPLDAPAPDGRRPGGTLAESRPAPPLAAEENKDLKRERNYPEQPPTIPHSIVGYRIDKDSNKCLSCHSRANSARTQAVMISITHTTWTATASRWPPSRRAATSACSAMCRNRT